MTPKFCVATKVSRRNSCNTGKGFLPGLSTPLVRDKARDEAISVVIPALNEEREIGECLESLACQTFTDFELIVVDNGSTDTTVSIARAYGVQVVHEPRRGPSYARDAGFQAARANIIATTDADTVVPLGWLQRIYRAFEEDSDVVAVFGPLRTKSASAPTSLGNFLLPYLDTGLVRGQQLAWNLGRPLFSGTNFAVQRKAFLKAQGFQSLKDGLVYANGEDILLGLKLHRLGKVQHLPELVVLTSARKFRPARTQTWNGIMSVVKKALPVYHIEKDL